MTSSLMRICGVVRPPVRAVMASHAGVPPLTTSSWTSTPLRASKAFARRHQGHWGWEYITTCAGIAQALPLLRPRATLLCGAPESAAACAEVADGRLVVQCSTEYRLDAVPPGCWAPSSSRPRDERRPARHFPGSRFSPLRPSGSGLLSAVCSPTNREPTARLGMV